MTSSSRFCAPPHSTVELAGTGFDVAGFYCNPETKTVGGAATGWLVTSAPVRGGETITLDFIIWSTNDQQLDTTVLLDHLVWLPETPSGIGATHPH